MSDDSLLRRLEALNRAPIAGTGREPGSPGAAGGQMAQPVRSIPIVPLPGRDKASRPNQSDTAGARMIPGLVRRGDVVQNAAGEHLRVGSWPPGSKSSRSSSSLLSKQ
jgi:hypothetical protein